MMHSEDIKKEDEIDLDDPMTKLFRRVMLARTASEQGSDLYCPSCYAHLPKTPMTTGYLIDGGLDAMRFGYFCTLCETGFEDINWRKVFLGSPVCLKEGKEPEYLRRIAVIAKDAAHAEQRFGELYSRCEKEPGESWKLEYIEELSVAEEISIENKLDELYDSGVRVLHLFRFEL